MGEKHKLIEVEIIRNSTTLQMPKSSEKFLTGLAELGYLSFNFLNYTNAKYIDDILPYKDIRMHTVGSLVIQCLEGIPKTDLPRTYCLWKHQLNLNKSRLPVLFPELQTLYLSAVYSTELGRKLQFPWYNETMKLPFNLSHSIFRQKLAPDGYHQKFGSQKFVRTLGIAGSPSIEIDHICPFEQRLNTIVFEYNQLRSVPSECFLSREGVPSLLYYLDLTGNVLVRLHDRTFMGLNRLETLTLRRSQIIDLQAGLFDDLVNLQQLDLDHNSLTFLRAGIFSKLVSLKLLFIHDNDLYYIEDSSFPIYSPNLTFVDLRWNKLHTFPYDCLKLVNLNLCDCDHNNISINLMEIMKHFDPIQMYFVQPLAFHSESYKPTDVGIMHENDQSEIRLRNNSIRTIHFHSSWTL